MSKGFPIRETYFSGLRPISNISDHFYEDVGNPEIICDTEKLKKPPKQVHKRPWKHIAISLLVAITLSVTIAGLTWYFMTKTVEPLSSKQLIHHNAKVIIRNAKTMFYLYSEVGNLSDDSQMRNVFLKKFLIPSMNGVWILEEDERFPGSFRIKSNFTGEYLYAGSKYDKEKRLIFTWKDSNSDLSLRSLHWEFVLVDEATKYYNIKNLEYGDWLFQASDNYGISQEWKIVNRSEAQFMDDTLQRIVFSMHNLKTIGPDGNWIIEPAQEGHDHIINYAANDTGSRLLYEGEVQNEVPFGSGIMLYKDGSTYVGQWSNGKRQGQGTLYFSKEDSGKRSDYVGSWQNDERNGFVNVTWIHDETKQRNWSNGLKHGKGKSVFSNEDPDLSNEGDWVAGEKTENGLFIWKNGSKYEGDWLNDLRHGKGKYVYSNESDGLSYEGDWVDDKKAGKGVLIFKNGDKFEGDWLNGERTGKGVFMWKNGDRYLGDFLNGWRTGKGVYFYENGNNYEGNWLNGEKNGKGVFIWKDGDKYVGDFLNDLKHGKGVFIFKNGNKFEGDFLNDLKHGKGVLIFRNGDNFEGDFLNDLKHGKGIYTWKNGNSYEGDWFENERTGKGVFIWKDGSKYVGDWFNNKRHGEGIQASASGKVLHQGKWENDNFVG